MLTQAYGEVSCLVQGTEHQLGQRSIPWLRQGRLCAPIAGRWLMPSPGGGSWGSQPPMGCPLRAALLCGAWCSLTGYELWLLRPEFPLTCVGVGISAPTPDVHWCGAGSQPSPSRVCIPVQGWVLWLAGVCLSGLGGITASYFLGGGVCVCVERC